MAKAAEILADRWTLLIVRELLSEVRHFNDLERGLPGISRTLLASRLRRLERSGVVERRATGRGHACEYHLTEAGQGLRPLVNEMVAWGARWAFGEPAATDLDPVLLLWWMRGRAHRDRLPSQRVVVQFDFYGAKSRRLWLLLSQRDVSICLQHPGFDVDLHVTADVATIFQIWLGRRELGEALRAEHVRVDGPARLVRAFAGWWAWSPVADVVRSTVRGD